MTMVVILEMKSVEAILSCSVQALSSANTPSDRRAHRSIRDSAITTLFRQGYPRQDLARMAGVRRETVYRIAQTMMRGAL